MLITALEIPWSEVALLPAAPDQPALGPDWFFIDPTGQPVWYNPVDQALHWPDQHALSVPLLSSALYLPDDQLLALTGRTLLLWEPDLSSYEAIPLPELAPDGPLTLHDQLPGTLDPFRNFHPLPFPGEAGPHSPTRPLPVTRTQNPDHTQTLRVAGKAYATGQPDQKLSGYILGDYLIVEQRDPQSAALSLSRYALPIGNPNATPIPLTPDPNRIYRPTHDLAIATDGTLWMMTPTPDALVFTPVSLLSQP